ncbi:fluoride efflux transporter CrcB [Motiliproteus sp. SC1-56]|uniref:fluoride efflux transporter CrcB n=1 Tax=Motiliproteus sp. SC1-56 TaxID=2799565 RepID=UPI001A905D9F|nr:fluoride efflux transporter CrcB [Motiliproteus sp. SC1-56]
MHLIYIALGGALGALARYWLSGFVVNNTDHYLPLGTLTVNVLGSLLMGACFVLIIEKSQWPPEFRQLAMVGFLGAFTTFSTFSLETVTLIQEGHIIPAAIYILLSVLCCVAALAAGIWFFRLLL